ncbi:hypothetical protein MRX96_015486 [Rhipicephalus microplus]
MTMKASYMMMRSGVRTNLSWLLLNAHLTDTTGRCLKEGPFERVKKFRQFHYQPRPSPAVNYYQSQDSYGQPLLDQSNYATDQSSTDIADDANVKSKATFSDLGAAPSVNKTPVTAPTPVMTQARSTPLTLAPVVTTAPPVTRAPTPPTPATTRATTGPTRVTTPPPPLLCSVGATPTAMRPRLPPDGYCDIIIYTHVRYTNHTIRPLINEIGFETFKNTCANYTRTTCGLSFDIMYVLLSTTRHRRLRTIPFEEHVNELKDKFHMDHYGILNIYGQKDFVDGVSLRAVPRTLSALRRLLGEDEERKKHKVFVGVGYRYLNETNAWSALTYTAANLATKDVDIVVIITTYLMPEGRKDCITLPVNAMKSPEPVHSGSGKPLHPANVAPEDASNMAKEGFASPSTIVAFTLQMGVPYYILTKQYGRPIDAMYEPCRMFGLTDYSQASCQSH